MSMHTKPRAQYKRVCRRCDDGFLASSNGALYCPPCRNIIKVERRLAAQAKKKQREEELRIRNARKPKGKIDEKWLIRGAISHDGGSDTISNGD